MRARAVLPLLEKRHDLLILAGGDAFHALSEDYPVVEIPTLCFKHNRHGRISPLGTIRANLPGIVDAHVGGPALDMVVGRIKAFRPDVVVYDSEVFTHRAAKRLGIPRICFDHFGMLVYCRVPLPLKDRAVLFFESLLYTALYGWPDGVVVSGFFTAEPKRHDVAFVGPVIRKEVQCLEPTRGEHIVVYAGNGDDTFTRAVHDALLGCGAPVRIYGLTRQGVEKNLHFKAFSNLGFLSDLASCRAVVATTGNQLLGEVLFMRKPILGMPMDCLEQRVNALQIERLGIGTVAHRASLTAGQVSSFLDREPEFTRGLHKIEDGATSAVKAIESYSSVAAPQGAAEVVNGSAPPCAHARSR